MSERKELMPHSTISREDILEEEEEEAATKYA